MFEQGQDVVRECSRFSVASKIKIQSRERRAELASGSKGQDRGRRTYMGSKFFTSHDLSCGSVVGL